MRIRRLEQYFDTTNSDMMDLGRRVDAMLSNLSKVTESMTALTKLQLEATTRGAGDGEEERGRPPTRRDPGGKGKGPARAPTTNGDNRNQAGPSQPRICDGTLHPPVLPPPGPDPNPDDSGSGGEGEENNNSE